MSRGYLMSHIYIIKIVKITLHDSASDFSEFVPITACLE